MGAAKSSILEVNIYRYNPETDAQPYMRTYEFDSKGKDVMVLDVLEQIKSRDATLSYRRSCREGVCGSDAMNINGINRLACVTRISEATQGKHTLIVRPLTGMPVIRDLVVDMSLFQRQYERVRPWLITHSPPPQKEYLQTPEERAKLDGLYECILCACCTSGCPAWWWNPESFVGPAGLLYAYRFLQDSRDTGEKERLYELRDRYSVYRCRNIENCAWVCPKGLNPMKAIDGIRTRLFKNLI